MKTLDAAIKHAKATARIFGYGSRIYHDTATGEYHAFAGSRGPLERRATLKEVARVSKSGGVTQEAPPIAIQGNPAMKAKRKTKSISRRSQITGKPPTARLKKRRTTMAILAKRGVRGVFPNPDRADHAIWVQIMRNGKWLDVDGYGNEHVAGAVARVFGNAGYTARVVRK